MKDISNNVRVISPRVINKILKLPKIQLANWDRLNYLPLDTRKKLGDTRLFTINDLLYIAILAKLQQSGIGIQLVKPQLKMLQNKIKNNHKVKLLKISPFKIEFDFEKLKNEVLSKLVKELKIVE